MAIFEAFSDLPFTDDNTGDVLTAHDGFRWKCPHCGKSLMGRGKARVVIVGTADLEFTEDGVTIEGAPMEVLGEDGFADAFAVCRSCNGKFRVTDELPSDLSNLIGG